MDFIKLEFSDLYQDKTWLILFEFNLIDAFNILRLMQEKDKVDRLYGPHLKYCLLWRPDLEPIQQHK